MRYLHGFAEHGHERFMTLAVKATSEIVLICPSLSKSQAERAGIGDVRSWSDGEDPIALFQELAQAWNLRSAIVAVDDELPAHLLLKMQEALPAALFKSGGEILASLMRTKDEQELGLMRKAARIADGAYQAALSALRAGTTEQDLQDVLNAEMRRLGGTPTFCIIAAGKNGAEPHHITDSTRISSGDVVVMDFGCSVEGYNSDITRVAACGKASEEAHRVYDVVYRAQEAGRVSIRPGTTCEEVDRAARQVIQDEGFGEFFVHRTGHGIGMNGHEEPYIVEGNEMALQPGYCFSVEPGVYLPGKFGVRIENIVTVAENGHESFNEEPSATLVEIV